MMGAERKTTTGGTMPEIDTDLFQVIALALLFFCLLALLAALSTLSKISKQLVAAPPARESAPATASPQQQPAATAAYDPSPTYSAPQAQTRADEVSTGFVSMTEAAPAASQPVAAQTAAGGLRGDEPEEQPFERDGRWWFKRGGELLVYDEGTGQWVASPGAGAVSASPAPGATTAVLHRTDTGEGWKCSACGAVNGSTATSCRMCFAPR